MSREIVFRGKSAFYPHNFIYGDLVSNKHNDLFINNIPYTAAIRVIKETAGQFTGARDKKGNMIFEGDIIQDPDGNIGHVIYSLRYLDYRVVYFNVKTGRDYHMRLSDWGYGCTNLVCEVIDNIHDSPDYLMKQYSSVPKYADKEAQEMDLVAMGQGIYEESLNG